MSDDELVDDEEFTSLFASDLSRRLADPNAVPLLAAASVGDRSILVAVPVFRSFCKSEEHARSSQQHGLCLHDVVVDVRAGRWVWIPGDEQPHLIASSSMVVTPGLRVFYAEARLSLHPRLRHPLPKGSTVTLTGLR